MRVLVVGAGFTGAVIARLLSDRGHTCVVIDERSHLAGNCHTERDEESGVMVHVYGPHIFHTDNEDVWNFMNRFGEMMPFVNRVKANVSGKIYSLPINLHTINQLFGKAMTPQEAIEFVKGKTVSFDHEPRTFKEQALAFVGEEIYAAFFEGYTKKQWGVEPSDLPASILKRLPLRFTYDDNYYNHRHQGIPRDGYTDIISKVLETANVEVQLGVSFEQYDGEFDHVVYTGPLDRYFNFRLGRLGYRTLDFEEIRSEGDFQGTAVINYCDEDVPFTRITEHKYFAPWEASQFSKTVCFREYSRSCGETDIPYYPIRLVDDKKLLEQYVELANSVSNVTFAGRLATYSYIDMDVAIARAMETADKLNLAFDSKSNAPVFVHNPI